MFEKRHKNHKLYTFKAITGTKNDSSCMAKTHFVFSYTGSLLIQLNFNQELRLQIPNAEMTLGYILRLLPMITILLLFYIGKAK